MALEEGQPRSQTKTSPRWGDAGQFTLLSHHLEISYRNVSREAFWYH
jgi:hypothetical protein